VGAIKRNIVATRISDTFPILAADLDLTFERCPTIIETSVKWHDSRPHRSTASSSLDSNFVSHTDPVFFRAVELINHRNNDKFRDYIAKKPRVIHQVSFFFILHSSFFILHSSFFILHSSFFILHSSFFTLHSSFSILHSPISLNSKIAKTDRIDDQQQETQTGRSLLHFSALCENPEALQLLVQCNMNVNMLDRHQNTALHLAARAGSAPCCKILLDHPKTNKNVCLSSSPHSSLPDCWIVGLFDCLIV